MLRILHGKVNKLLEMEELKLEEIIKEVKLRLTYIAGKRAETDKEYFRHIACEADHEMLYILANDAQMWLDLKLKSEGSKFHIQQNVYRSLWIYTTIYRWLEISGLAQAERWRNKIMETIAEIREQTRRHPPLKTRPVPPV